MKFRKFIMQLGLLSVVTCLFLLFGNAVSGEAAATLPAGAGLVDTDSAVYTGYSSTPGWVGSSGIGTNAGSKPNWSITGFPTMQTAIAANGLSSTKRVTNRTTKIYIAMSGTFSIPNSSSAKITSLRPDVMKASLGSVGATQSVAKTPAADLVSSPVKSVTLSSTKYYEIDVDFSNIFSSLPFLVGFRAKTSDTSTDSSFIYAEITANSEISDSYSHMPSQGTPIYINSIKVNQTYSKPSTSTINYIKSSDTKITGTAFHNTEIWAFLTDAAGNTKMVTTTSSDPLNDGTHDGPYYGNYSLDLGGVVGKLSKSSVVSVYEGNDMGDNQSAAAMYKDVLDIAVANPDVTVNPAEFEDDIDGKSDDDFLAWMIKKTGISVTHNGDLLNPNDLTFKSYDSAGNNATEITNLASYFSGKDYGTKTPIWIGASTKNSPVVSTDNKVEVTLTKTPGALSFGPISPTMTFDDAVVPSQKTNYEPNASYEVNIDDTRATGSPWYVTANATPLSSGQHTVDGGLVYENKDGSTDSLTNNSTLVASGNRVKGVESENVASNWAMPGSNSGKNMGIFVSAGPHTYSGIDGTTYKGDITWELTDSVTPG